MSRAAAATDVFTAIAEPRRRQIIDLLSRRRLAVGAIVLALGLRQPSVSKHLSVLREAGLVRVNKEGQQRFYELNLDPLRPVYDWVKTFEQHWDHQLDRIKERAERRALALSDAISSSNASRATPTSHESGRTNRKKGAS
jgi:DNA-binding transcriptional ArsR family regulator